LSKSFFAQDFYGFLCRDKETANLFRLFLCVASSKQQPPEIT